MDFLNNKLPDKCAQLIVADPPYFGVKGEFDFIWATFEDYLKDVEKWVKECKRLLADNGTLIWYGSSRNIAYSQIILDEHFTLLSNVTVNVYNRQTKRIKVEDARCFLNTSERFLMYSNEKENLTKAVFEIRDYVRAEIKKSKGRIVLKEINQVFGTATNGGGVASACLSLNKAEPAMLTEEMYIKLQEWCAPNLTTSYADLRSQYEEKTRVFNPVDEYKMDVLTVSQETHITGKYDHETAKPETLTRIIILTCSKEGDLVLVPFAGSGTECAMSVKEKRRFVAFEIEVKYVDQTNKRVGVIIDKPTLF